MPFAATWIGLGIVILSAVSQTEEDKYHMTSLICGIYKKAANELIHKTKNLTTVESKFMVIEGLGRGVNGKIGINTYTLLGIK